MKFEKGNWYSDGKRFYQYDCESHPTKNTHYEFRIAGCNEPSAVFYRLNDLAMLTPASLTPDFSNAKVGDECWHGVAGFMLVNDIYDDGKAISIKYDNSPKAKKYRGDESDLGGITTIYTYRNGYMPFRHPELFNSFAQFLAYWQEEALKLKGDE